MTSANDKRRKLKILLPFKLKNDCYVSGNIIWNTVKVGDIDAIEYKQEVGDIEAIEYIQALRNLGYRASLFPEGDGITFMKYNNDGNIIFESSEICNYIDVSYMPALHVVLIDIINEYTRPLRIFDELAALFPLFDIQT
jgi:hypothetical protein